MWQLKFAATTIGVIGLSLAITLLAPDLNNLTRVVGLALIVTLAIFGVRWTSKACNEPGKLALALFGGALLGGLLLIVVAQPTKEELTGAIDVGILIGIGLRRAGLLLVATMGPMALFELLRWRLEKAMAKMREEQTEV